MPVRCYQVSDFSYDPVGGFLAVTTVTMRPSSSDLLKVLKLVAPSIEARGRSATMFDPSELFWCHPDEVPDLLKLLDQHREPRVTAITDCEVALCLDFYQHPVDDGADNWARTEIGSLVYQAKYRGAARAVGPRLAERALDVVNQHPVLRRAGAVAAVPSSQALGPAEDGVPYGIARTIAMSLGVPVVNLARRAKTRVAQKNVGDDDPVENQRNTMEVQGDCPSRVLLIDDLMMHGSSISEAARALHSGGSTEVSALVLVKEYRGTSGYQFR